MERSYLTLWEFPCFCKAYAQLYQDKGNGQKPFYASANTMSNSTLVYEARIHNFSHYLFHQWVQCQGAIASAASEGLTLMCSSELLTIDTSAEGEFPPTSQTYTNLLHINPNDDIQLHVLHSQQQVRRLIAIRKNTCTTCSPHSTAMVTMAKFLTTVAFPDTETTSSILPARPCRFSCGMQ